MRPALNKKSAQKQKPRLQTTASRKPLFQSKKRGLNTHKNAKPNPLIVRSSMRGFLVSIQPILSVQ